MSRINQSSPFRAEDFPDQSDWMPKFLNPMNRFLTEVVAAVNGGITPEDNSKAILKTVSGRIDLPISFQWSFIQNKPIETRVCQAQKNGIPRAVVLAWGYASGTLSVTKLVDSETGLSIQGEDGWEVVIRASV